MRYLLYFLKLNLTDCHITSLFCSTTKSGVLSLIFVVCFSDWNKHHRNHKNIEILHWQVTPPSVAKARPAIPISLVRRGYLTFSRALSAIDIPLPPSDIQPHFYLSTELESFLPAQKSPFVLFTTIISYPTWREEFITVPSVAILTVFEACHYACPPLP